MTERRERILGTLAELLREIWPEHPRRALHPATALTDLGLSSAHFVAFLSRGVHELDVDWEDQAPPPGALAALDGIAAQLAAEPGS